MIGKIIIDGVIGNAVQDVAIAVGVGANGIVEVDEVKENKNKNHAAPTFGYQV